MKTNGLFMALLLASASASAAARGYDGWDRSFVAGAVSSYVDRDGLRLMVVAAGDSAAAPAAAALMEALRAGKRASLVMDASSLGAIDGLGDKEIVERASKAPVDRIAVVRVFAGDQPSAVVALYNDKGESQGAMTVRKGERLVENGRRRSSGVSSVTASVVGEVVGNKTSSTASAQEEFERRALWLQGMTSVSANQYGAWTNSWAEPRQGKYGKPLQWNEFFSLVGRNDLSQQIDAADNSGARAAGTPLAVTGALGTMIFGATCGVLWLVGDYDVDTGEKTHPLPVKSGVATAVSAAVMVTGIKMLSSAPQYPEVPINEVREMADRYNKSLRKELGLSEEIAATSRPYVAPVMGPGGVLGATVGVSF